MNEFWIRGRVVDTGGEVLDNVLVRALDADLPSRQPDGGVLLGEAVADREGGFTIHYSRDAFARGDQATADLVLQVLVDRAERTIVRAVIDDREITPSRPLFNAPVECTAELTVTTLDEQQSSEYGRLRSAVDPVLDGLSPAALSTEDIRFLTEETRIERELIELLAESARCCQEWSAPIEAGYGLARAGLPLDRSTLAEVGTRQLSEMLLAAIGSVLPTEFRDRVPRAVAAIVGARPTRTVEVRLVEESDERPLASTTVELVDVTTEGHPIELGTAVTDSDGWLLATHPTTDDESHRVSLRIRRRFGDEPQHVEISTPTAESTIRVPPGPAGLVEAQAHELGLSGAVIDGLNAAELTTWSAIRRAGDLKAHPGLAELGGEVLDRLTAHADLSRISGTASIRSAMLEAGFASASAVSSTIRGDFISAVGDAIGDLHAARLHAAASAQARLVETLLIGGASDATTRAAGATADPLPQPIASGCGCGECTSALSPLAYLADLTRYATDHIRVAGAAISAVQLERALRQDVSELPVSCGAAKQSLSEARLVVESLRSLLAERPQPDDVADPRAKAEEEYRLAAYERLLVALGTSFAQLRALRTADEAARGAVAERLGLALTIPRPEAGDELERLLLAESSGRTEAALEELFGLVDTTRHPLSGGPVLNDSLHQIERWSFADVDLGHNISEEGSVFITLTASPAGDVQVDVYADRERRRHVAAAVSPSPAGAVALVPENDSRLRGTLHLAYSGDTPAGSEIELVVLPRLLCWRAARLRRDWRTEDEAGRRYRDAVIDPDIVPAGWLRRALAGPAAALHAARRAAIEQRLAALRVHHESVAAPQVAAAFEDLLRDAFATGGAELSALHERWRNGSDVTADLAALRISPAALGRIVDLAAIVQAGRELLTSEWRELDSIALGSWKRKLTPDWRDEELAAGVALSPDHFRMGEVEPARIEFSSWRVDPLAQMAWTEVLSARAAQYEAAVAGLADAVVQTEEAAMPALRDALIRAAAPVGADTEAAYDWASTRLLVDARVGGCQRTTRIAHAIEALQHLFEAIVEERPANPGWTLTAPDYHREWQWLGSYASWRSALFVYMQPHTLLLPTLKTPKSPGFSALLDGLSAQPANGARVEALMAEFARYVEDVCSLEVSAHCVAQAKLVGGGGYPAEGYRCLQFLFGRAPASGRLYFSITDPDSAGAFPQRPWTPVDTGEGFVSEVVGAVGYVTPSGNAWVYVFAKRLVGVVEQLVFTRLDLETFAWSPVQALALPAGATRFDALLVTRTMVPFGGIPRSVNYSLAPQLLIRVRDLGKNLTGQWWERQLDDNGDGWEANNFSELELGATTDVHAVLDQGSNALFLVVQAGPDLWCVMFSSVNGGGRTPVNGRRYMVAGSTWLIDHTFRGAMLFQYVADNKFLANELFLLTGRPDGSLQAARIRRAAADLITVVVVPSALPAGVRLVNGSGAPDKSGSVNWVVLRPDDPSRAASYGLLRRVTSDGSGATLVSTQPTRPGAIGSVPSSARQTTSALQMRRQVQEKAYAATLTRAQRQFLDEAFYFAPMSAGLALVRAGDHRAAHAWFRFAYDTDAPADRRKIAWLLREEEKLSDLSARAVDWLLDPLNAHRIAATRRHAYFRYTLNIIAGTLIDEADAEFAADTSESRARARRRYEEALAVLDAPELTAVEDRCAVLVGLLGGDVELQDPAAASALVELKAIAGTISDPGVLEAAVATANQALGADAPWSVRFADARTTMDRARATVTASIGNLLDARMAAAAQARDVLLRDPGVDEALIRVGQAQADATVRAVRALTGLPSDGDGGGMRWLRGGSAPVVTLGRQAIEMRPPVARLLTAGTAEPDIALGLMVPAGYVPAAPLGFCVPPDPTVAALRSRARLNLTKLRTCRNLVGMTRVADPYAAPTDATSGLPTVVGDGVVVPSAPSGPALPPTQYRYATLIERAKQLAQQASQVEASMLHAIEAGQAAGAASFGARQQAERNLALVRLQAARKVEAAQTVVLAGLQEARAQMQLATYDQWLQAGPLGWELALADSYRDLRDAQEDLAGWDVTVQTLQTMASAAAGGATGAAAAIPFATAAALAMAPRAIAATDIAGAQYRTQLYALYASQALRERELVLQRDAAGADVAIGHQNVEIATAHVGVIDTEIEIAETNATMAQDLLTYLDGQFLNTTRYAWLAEQLERTYQFLLREATTVTRLALAELAFSRQQTPPVQIAESYWRATSGQLGAASDERGLGGSARMLADIARLDQWAFVSRRRAQILSKTISLARFAPGEFHRFRETGVIVFNAPLELFDADFPGHYMRQIQRVRISVVALIPPTDGIHAQLSSSGISRVVIGPDQFRRVVLRRDPETIALTSPIGSAEPGLIAMEANADLAQPFEGHGVDTTLEFRMPRASNAFDFTSCADVLVTYDYSALSSEDYRRQVQRELSPRLKAERPFSVRLDFADAWYDLHNPDLLAAEDQLRVHLRVQRGDFPPNLDRLSVDHVMLAVGRADGFDAELSIAGLRFTPIEGGGSVGGGATTTDGIISTRRSNGTALIPIIGGTPVGDWELSFSVTPQTKSWFSEDRITDLLLVISYSGVRPDWPD